MGGTHKVPGFVFSTHLDDAPQVGQNDGVQLFPGIVDGTIATLSKITVEVVARHDVVRKAGRWFAQALAVHGNGVGHAQFRIGQQLGQRDIGGVVRVHVDVQKAFFTGGQHQ